MSDQKYTNMEDIITSFVDEAVNSMDFQSLDKDISDSIKSVFDELNITQPQKTPDSHKVNYHQSESKVQAHKGDQGSVEKQIKKPRFIKNPPGELSGKICKIAGIAGSAIFALSFLVALIGKITGSGAGLFSPLVLLILFVLLTVYGEKKSARCRRFQTYKRVIGDRTFCQIEELSKAVHKSGSFVLDELQGMIREKFFYNAHIDQQGTCLMLDDVSYGQYLDSQHAYNERLKNKKSGADEIRDPELVRAIEEGDRYISAIRRANDLVPDPVITDKLNRLETTLRNIFDVLAKKPDQLPKLRKFMKYYMPTTLKLVQTYQELDSQASQSETITRSKKEIEQTLDTINAAYEKLLDSFFEDQAMDVSSDISVLETMLAQEGLTENHL